jgi:AraC-like DNA-binding protein
MRWRSQIYIDPTEVVAPGRVHVPSMGVREVMPPGLVRHGGAGSNYPCLIMMFHNRAWSMAPDRKEWLPAGHRLVVWPHEARHEYGNSSRTWNHSWLRVSGRWIDRVLRHTRIPLGVPIDLGGETMPMHYLQMISDELRGNVRQDPDMLEGLLQVFWHDLERRAGAGPSPRRADSRLEQARRFIEARFDQPFSLAETAEQAHLSPSHFCSSFSRQFGVPPREYAMRLRLQRGAQLLANRDLAVYQVAEMAGCPDALYFSRLFRQRYGVSPGQFRRQLHSDSR